MKQEELLPLLGKQVKAMVSVAGRKPQEFNGLIRKAIGGGPIGICLERNNQFIIGDSITNIVRKPGFIVLLVLGIGGYQPVFADDGMLMFFNSEAEAQGEIDDCVSGTEEAVAHGHMDEAYTKDDYTIAPAFLEGTTITSIWEGDTYTMDQSEDDWHRA